MTTRRTAVLGLGPMGRALATAMLDADEEVLVWNRTPGRAVELVQAGATEVVDPGAALAGADLAIVCVRDDAAVRRVFEAVSATALRATTVVNLTSATPEQARALSGWAADRGMAYLSGAIMVPTPLVGDPDAVVLYAGEESLLRRHESRLRALGGVVDYRGADPGSAALFDVAMLEVFFAGLTAYLHASAMLTAAGFRAEDFVTYGAQMAELAARSFAGLARDVDADAYPGDEDRLAMNVTFMEHIVRTGRDAGVDGTLPEALLDLGRRAVAAGHGEDGFSALARVLRTPS